MREVGRSFLDSAEQPVTVAEFRRFVNESGYVTVAELPSRKPLSTTPMPTRRCSCPGSLVFPAYERGRWTSRVLRQLVAAPPSREPSGEIQPVPAAKLGGKERQPGRPHLGLGKTLEAYPGLGRQGRFQPKPNGSSPREAAWKQPLCGDEFAPRGRMLANTWQGEFPGRTCRTRRLRRHEPRRLIPPQRIRPLSTWPATSGNGRSTDSSSRRSTRVAGRSETTPRSATPAT